MHISEGVLSPEMIIITNTIAIGSLVYASKGIKEKELPQIALLGAVFCVASTIHFRIGLSSVHLLMTGLIGLILGKRTPLALFASLLFQLVILHYGGITSLGANILTTSIPAMLVGHFVRKAIRKSANPILCGGLDGLLSVMFTVFLVVLVLIQSNQHFGIGVFSAAKVLFISHLPVMIIEGIVTAFAVEYILKVKPEIILEEKNGKKKY